MQYIRGRKLLERKLVRRARGGGRFSGLAHRTTMTILTYEEKKYIYQKIFKGASADKADFKLHKCDWFSNPWLPVPQEVNPIKLGIFTNHRYTRLRKIMSCLSNFDEINIFKYDDSAHMHVPRIIGFRYTTDYQDLGDKMGDDITFDEYELENRLVRVKNVLNRSQRYAFTFSYKPEYRLDPER